MFRSPRHTRAAARIARVAAAAAAALLLAACGDKKGPTETDDEEEERTYRVGQPPKASLSYSATQPAAPGTPGPAAR